LEWFLFQEHGARGLLAEKLIYKVASCQQDSQLIGRHQPAYIDIFFAI
jgi:hypothetical protein